MPNHARTDIAARLEDLLQRYAEPDAPEDLRLEAAEALAEAIAKMPPAKDWMDIFRRMAVDKAPIVRRAVARALPDMPDEEFSPLAGRLAEDENQYVRDATAKALERRNRKQRQNRKARKEVADFQGRYQTFEKTYGARAARQARRMANEMFDVLVGGTLHDMENILSPMRIDLDLIRKHLDSGKPGRASCRIKAERFSQQVEYLQAFLNDMRTYARSDAGKRSRVNVGDLARRALALAREGLQAAGVDTEAVAVEVEAPETLCASLYPRLATTALTHLIRNGLEMLAEATVAGQKRLTVRARSDGAGGVQIGVEDNGPGIEPKLLMELMAFAPGKTTRKDRGTGFGLPTAHRFAEAHGGRLDIESRPGAGAVFTLLLPASEETDE